MKVQSSNESELVQKTLFQPTCTFDYSQFEIYNPNSLHFSPYNPFLFIEKQNKGRLFKYFNTKFDELKYQNGCSDCQDKLFCFQCLFMKNFNQFIVVTGDSLHFNIIEQEKKWKTFQVIKDRGNFLSADLSSDEQTLYTNGMDFQVFTRQGDGKWFPYFKIDLYDSITNVLSSESKNFAAIFCYDRQYLFRTRRIFYFKINYLTQHINTNPSFLVQDDNFILTRHLIIQWNKQIKKILRQYKPKLWNHHVNLQSYDKSSGLICCCPMGKTVICKFENGQLKIQQILKETNIDNAQFCNNGMLLINRDNKKIEIFEKQ